MRVRLLVGCFCLALAVVTYFVISRRSAESPPSPPQETIEHGERGTARMEAPAESRGARPRPRHGGTVHAAAVGHVLSVRVVLPDGSPASRARVALLQAPCTGQFPRSPDFAGATTDSTGAVELDWRGEETVLYAWTSDHAGIALLGDFERKARKRSVTLHPAQAVTVVVVDSEGGPIAGATVTGCARPSGASVYLHEFSASRAGVPWGPRPLIALAKTTDSQGTCLIPPLPEGDFDVGERFDVELINPPGVRREVWVEMRGHRSERRALDAPTVRGRQRITDRGSRPGRVSAGTARGRMLGSRCYHYWEAVAERVTPGADTRLELRHVPAVLVELVGPDPRPQGFHRSSVVVFARSATGRADNDWIFEDGFFGRRRIVHLDGTPPWTLVAKHATLEPVEVELGSPLLGPDDPLPVHKLELRARQIGDGRR